MTGKILILKGVKPYRIFIALRGAIGWIVGLCSSHTFTIAAHLEMKSPRWIRITCS